MHSQYNGRRVGPGWLKYEFSDTVWNLDDGMSSFVPPISPSNRSMPLSEPDYTIFTWRQHQLQRETTSSPASMTLTPAIASSSSTDDTSRTIRSPTIHLHDPTVPLPKFPEYQNPAYHVFRRAQIQVINSSTSPGRPKSLAKSRKSRGSGGSSQREGDGTGSQPDDGVPRFKREFEKFHSENGVRTVIGTIGPVKNGW